VLGCETGVGATKAVGEKKDEKRELGGSSRYKSRGTGSSGEGDILKLVTTEGGEEAGRDKRGTMVEKEREQERP